MRPDSRYVWTPFLAAAVLSVCGGGQAESTTELTGIGSVAAPSQVTGSVPHYDEPLEAPVARNAQRLELPVRALKTPDAVNGLDFIPGRDQLVVGLNREVLIIDAISLETTATIDGCESCLLAGVHGLPDGNHVVVSGNWKKPGEVWSLDPLEKVSVARPGTPRARYSMDGRYRLDSLEREAHLIDMATNESVWNSHLPDPKALAFSPDGRQLVIGYDDDARGRNAGSLQILRAADKAILAKISYERATFTFAEFTPDGTTLALGAYNGRIILWDVETGELAGRFHAGDGLRSMTISPDGKYIAAGGGREMAGYAGLWRISDARPMARFRFQERVAGLDFHDTKPLLAVGHWADGLAVIDLSTLE